MPNWCSNDLYVYGPKKDRESFANFMESEESFFDFNQILPYPDVYAKADKACKEYTDQHGYSPDRPKDGYNHGGYEWSCSTWGTKWNSSYVTFEKRSRSLFYQFETAWSPPLPVVKELAKRFPTLTLKIKYFEYGVGYQGSNLYEEGILVEEKTTDYHGNRGG